LLQLKKFVWLKVSAMPPVWVTASITSIGITQGVYFWDEAKHVSLQIAIGPRSGWYVILLC